MTLNTAKKTRKPTATAAPRLIKAASASDVVVGIDVSEDQRTIDWSATASSVNFAIIKATDGVDADPNFHTNWTTARAASVKTGAYHFFRNFHTAQEQFSQLVTDPGDFPIALDIENTPKYQLKALDVPVIGEFLSLIRGQYGKLPIIYTDNGSWASLGNPASANGISFVECPLWIAYLEPIPSISLALDCMDILAIQLERIDSGNKHRCRPQSVCGKSDSLPAHCVFIQRAETRVIMWDSTAAGYNLSGYCWLKFWARADQPSVVEFKVGGIIANTRSATSSEKVDVSGGGARQTTPFGAYGSPKSCPTRKTTAPRHLSTTHAPHVGLCNSRFSHETHKPKVGRSSWITANRSASGRSIRGWGTQSGAPTTK